MAETELGGGSIRLNPGANHDELIVEDTGLGILEESRDAVCDLFHRLPGTTGICSGPGPDWRLSSGSR